MIIVTGGAGFIGSAIIAELNRRGEKDILVVDRLGTDQKWKNLRSLRFADYVEKDEFLEMVQANRICPPIKALIHMGACSSTTERDASFLVRNNYAYTKTLAQWAQSAKVRFIYASSAATYGDGSEGFSDNAEQIHRLRPLNMYGYSKQMFDLWARKAGLLEKFVGLKYFNVFGPNEYHKGGMRSFVLKAYEQIRHTGKVRLFRSHREDFANGQQQRDFLYIKDAVDMTLYFLDNPQTAGLYNIGTGKARTWNDLAAAVFSAMGEDANIEYFDMPEDIRWQYQYYTQADINKIQKAGYKRKPKSLEEGITDYVRNYLLKGQYLSGQSD